MSFTRNRSQSSDSPNVKPRVLQQHLQGAHDAITAFEGYESSGPLIQSSVLERPAKRQQLTVWEMLFEKGRRLVSAVVQSFQR